MLSPLRPLPFFVFLVSFVVNLPFVVPNGGRVFNDGWMAFDSDDPPLQKIRAALRYVVPVVHFSLTTNHFSL
jgi:hypothetical protein